MGVNWNENTVSVYKKCRHRLHFFLKLSKFEFSQSMLSAFYQAAVQSVLFYCVLCYHSSLSAENMNKLEHGKTNYQVHPYYTTSQLALSLHNKEDRKHLTRCNTSTTHHIHSSDIRQAVSVHFCMHCPFVPSAIRALNS